MSKHWTMCNPWNFNCNMSIYSSSMCIQHSTHLQSLHPDTSLSLPQAPTPAPPNDDKHDDAKHDQLAVKKSQHLVKCLQPSLMVSGWVLHHFMALSPLHLTNTLIHQHTASP